MEEGTYIYVANATLNGVRNYDKANEVLPIVNEERAKVGLAPLEYNQELVEVAMKRAAETSIYWSHIRPCGMDCFTIEPIFDGENIGAITTTPTNVMKSWMNSTFHKAAILNENYQSIGIGCYIISDTYYWVQTFSTDKSTKTTQISGVVDSQDTVRIQRNAGKIILNVYGLEEQMQLQVGETKQPTKVALTNVGMVKNNRPYIKTQIALSDVTWKSSNENVFKVDKQGKITAIGEGIATLTASFGEETHSATIEVTDGLDSITIPNSATLKIGETTTLPITYEPADYDGSKNATWKSSDETVAIVDNNGKVTAKGPGKATIQVSIGSKTATCEVTVSYQMKLNYTSYQINGLNESLTLKDAYLPGTAITWTSSNEKVATIDSNGKVTPKNGGFAKIRASTEAYGKAQCWIYVCALVELPDGSKAYPGDLDRNGVINSNDITILSDWYNEKIYFTEGETLVGDIDGNGIVNSIDASILSDIFNSDSFHPGAYTPITNITLNKTNASLDPQETILLQASITPKENTDSPKITWKSGNNRIATVDENGKVTAIAGGTTEITATTSNGKKATCHITVSGEPALLKGDINQDGSVTLYDAFKILEKAILEGDLTADESYIMDYNEDGAITLYDAFKFLEMAILG